MDTGHHQIERLLQTDGRRLHALLYRLTLSLDAADDLLQELCVRLMRARLDAVEQLAGYATRTAIHLALDWRGRKQRESPSELPEPMDGQAMPLESAQNSESLQRTVEAIQKLREPLREIVILRYIEEQSYESIAATLGKTPHQVRGLAHKAIQALRVRLHELGADTSRRLIHARNK